MKKNPVTKRERNDQALHDDIVVPDRHYRSHDPESPDKMEQIDQVSDSSDETIKIKDFRSLQDDDE